MYGYWKRRSDSLVQMTVEGEVEGKDRPGRRKTGWIDNIPSGNGQREEWSWLDRHTRECRRFYKDYGNTAAAAAAFNDHQNYCEPSADVHGYKTLH